MDLRTLFAAFSWVTLWSVVVLFLAFRRIRVFPGSREWMVGHLLYGIGTLLVALRDLIPDHFSIFLANFILLIAPVFLGNSMARFFGKERWRRPLIGAGTVSGLVFCGIALVGDVRWRVLAFSLLHGILWIPFFAITFQASRDQRSMPATGLLAVASLLTILLSFLRVIPSMQLPLIGSLYIENNGLLTYTIFGLLSLYILMLGGYLLLLLERFNADHKATIAELDETIKARDRFVSIVSHDIGGPLAAVRMGLHVVSEEMDPQKRSMDEIEFREVISMLKSSVERILSLQQDLVEWYRTKRQQQKYNFENTDVGYITTPVLELYRDQLMSRNLELILEENASRESIFCDVNSMRTVFRNVFSNAIRFTPNGGSISLQTFQWESWIVLRIFNSGSVIHESTLEQIRTGMRVVPTKSVSGEVGSGMGLVLASEYTKANHAAIDIQSVTGGVEVKIRVQRSA